MNIPTIEIEPERAKRELAHFRGLRDEQRQAEDEAFQRAYRMAAKGHSLIDLNTAMQAAGVGDDGLPKLAIARADAPMVYYRARRTPEFTTKVAPLSRWDGGAPDWWASWHHRQAFPALQGSWPRTDNRGVQSAVPVVPPEFRPRWKLSNYHILWEVEQWDVAPPPADPMLLRSCGGSLFAVLAAWDLTELESAILQRRFDA